MKLLGIIKRNQLQMPGAAAHIQALAGQQITLGAAVCAGVGAVAVLGVSNDLQAPACGKDERRNMYVVGADRRQHHDIGSGIQNGPPAEKEYAVDPVGVAKIMPSLR